MHKNVWKLLNGDTVCTRLEVKYAIGSENDGDWKEPLGRDWSPTSCLKLGNFSVRACC